MRLEEYKSRLEEAGIKYEENAPMKNRTTFKIGGAADILVFPADAAELTAALKAARECGVPYFILGNGSNILVSDGGIAGAVIDTSSISEITVNGNEMTCGAGVSLRKVCLAARDASLTGLEFAYGIPGTVGGAFYMNAGAYGGEISDAAVSAVCLDKELNTVTVDRADMDFGYRKSVFRSGEYIILSVKLALKAGDCGEIAAKMEEILKKRAEKQPLEYPSAGSTFKRPAGSYAGMLIEQAGLKGVSSGGARVSESTPAL